MHARIILHVITQATVNKPYSECIIRRSGDALLVVGL